MHPSSPHRSLDSFFSSEDRVLVIKGAWGVGKTFLWNAYVEGRLSNGDLSQLAYSYVSLFGKSSLADVRAAVFQNAKPISTAERIEQAFDEELTSSTTLLQRVPWICNASNIVRGKSTLLGWLTNLARSTPFTDKYSGIIASIEYGLVKNYIICFDDLERKGSGLTVREVMGLADELAQRKACKVILVFNEDSLSDDKDKRDFEFYREKVVDAEITYDPTHAENVQRALGSGHALTAQIERISTALDLKNIRVLKKFYRLISALQPELTGCDESIMSEFVNHAAVLCWSYYMRGTALPFDFVRSRLEESSWSSYLRKKDEELPPEEKRYRSIASQIDLSPSIFDKPIIQFLEHGYFDIGELRNDVEELRAKVEVRRAHAELNVAWKLYSHTFADNQTQIIESLRRVLEQDSSKLSVSEVAGAMEMLVEFGEDVTPLLERYVSQNAQALAAMNQHDSFLTRRITFSPLLDKVKDIQANRTPLDIDSVAMKIAINRGYNPEDIDFLCSLSADDFYAWLKTNPDDLPTKLRSGLFLFGNLQSSKTEDMRKYSHIYTNVKNALFKIGADSPLNQKRVKHVYEMGEET